MTNKQLEMAKEAGCVSAKQLHIWYNGYLLGQKDCLDDVREYNLEDEARMLKKEEDEHYADYSDQDEAYNKASSNKGELI